ncbi:MAG: DNA repair protein RadA [Bacteroidetes bacterium 4572_112]|nr:MAG: DNA repair protein RadA [Bacteroidetes bacterium 4572_112]
MAKVKSKTSFFCKSCGNEYAKWMGKCSACGEWNTIVEETIRIETAPKWKKEESQNTKKVPQPIHKLKHTSEDRIDMHNQELNRVLGGGLVRGSLVLLGGEPGIGKSTLLLQVAIKAKNLKILYISGEESEQQIRMRADRIGIENEHCYILNETRTESIFHHLANMDKVDILVIDSIQTLMSERIDNTAGSITQIRETTAELQRFAKESHIPVFIVGHITKDGSIAGPKLLEHMVDTVLQFEGDRNYGYRILRSLKNRFGSTSELGIYEMLSNGMREVSNPSEILISQRDEQSSGVAISATMEGGRAMLIEVQALASTAVYGTPQRSAMGFDTRRLNMLLAVLEKKAGFKLNTKDVFLNIAGGIKVDDPAIDLAVISAILSSNYDMPIEDNVCFAAEVGLSGEIRSVNHADQRIREAEKLGFSKIHISKYSLKGIHQKNFKIQIVGHSTLEQVFKSLFVKN